jgi:hypothetical protein
LLLAYPQYTEAVPVYEFKERVFRAELGKVFVHTKVVSSHVSVMKEYNGSIRELREPAFKVMADGLVGVKAIDVKEVDRAFIEPIQGLVKGTPKKGGKLRVVGLIVGLHLLVDVIVIVACLIIPLPGIHTVRWCIQPQPFDCLAK